MRLAFVISCLEMGGAQRVAVLLIEQLKRRGWDVVLIATYSGKTTSFYRIPEGVQTYTLSDMVGPTRSRLVSRVLRLVVLRRLLARVQPTVVVSFLTDANIAALLALLGTGVPTIVSERNYPPHDKVPAIYRVLRRICYPLATRVVMQTNLGLDWLAMHVRKAQGRVIPNPVTYPLPILDPVITPPEDQLRTRKLIVAVGRLSPQKGFDLLIRAFARISDPEDSWTLAILGDGPERSGLESLCQAERVSDKVLLPGAVGNVGDWYERAELFVLSSRYEGFPNSLAEAMAHGCACISFDCKSGPRDLIEHGRNGMLVPVASVDALRDTLQDLMENQVLRRQLGAAARGVRETFSLEKVVSMWEEELPRSTAVSSGELGPADLGA